MHQISFDYDKPIIYLVATPIGNLDELTQRAINILKEVEVIFCEDKRVTIKLLNHFNIKTKLISLHQHNENEKVKEVIDYLSMNKSVAIVSDAGYPLISDPGYVIVQQAIKEGFSVVPISGSCAFINAIVASAITTDAFSFFGFLPHNKNQKLQKLNEIALIHHSLIFYESPYRILQTLTLINEVFKNPVVCVAKELTKLYEQFFRGKLNEVIEEIETSKIAGEYVIIVENKPIKNNGEIVASDEALITQIDQEIKNGKSTKEAIVCVAKKCNISKNKIYNLYHKK